MQILIDECLPKKLKKELDRFSVFTVQERGWAGKKNGELLQLAERDFDVFLTADQNIESQQNLKCFNITVVVLVAPQNKLEILLPLMGKLSNELQNIQPYEIVYIEP